jgi:homoserine dehydrogenase
MKKVNIGLIGFGKIGSGVVKALRAKRAFLKEERCRYKIGPDMR